MKRWEVKCPLKVILLGEHAVLYTKRAVTMAVDLYLTMNIEESIEKVQIIFNNELFYKGPIPSGEPCLDISFDGLEDNEYQVVNGILHVIRQLCIGCTINIISDIPLGCGLGTSAAASISLALGCLTLANYKHSLNLSPVQIKELSYTLAHDLDNFIHGQGSGIDVLTCFYGGIQYYDGRSANNGSVRKYCKSLHLDLPPIHVIYSRIPKDTRKMVSNVSKQYNLYPKVILSIMQSIDELISSLLEGCLISDLANYCHDLLCCLNVSHPKLQQGISILKNNNLAHNKVSCKLTGAGSGGCLISFGQLSNTQLQQLVKQEFDVYSVNLAKQGVLISSIDNIY